MLARILAEPLSRWRIRPTPNLFAEPSRPRAIIFKYLSNRDGPPYMIFKKSRGPRLIRPKSVVPSPTYDKSNRSR